MPSLPSASGAGAGTGGGGAGALRMGAPAEDRSALPGSGSAAQGSQDPKSWGRGAEKSLAARSGRAGSGSAIPGVTGAELSRAATGFGTESTGAGSDPPWPEGSSPVAPWSGKLGGTGMDGGSSRMMTERSALRKPIRKVSLNQQGHLTSFCPGTMPALAVPRWYPLPLPRARQPVAGPVDCGFGWLRLAPPILEARASGTTNRDAKPPRDAEVGTIAAKRPPTILRRPRPGRARVRGLWPAWLRSPPGSAAEPGEPCRSGCLRPCSVGWSPPEAVPHRRPPGWLNRLHGRPLTTPSQGGAER